MSTKPSLAATTSSKQIEEAVALADYVRETVDPKDQALVVAMAQLIAGNYLSIVLDEIQNTLAFIHTELARANAK